MEAHRDAANRRDAVRRQDRCWDGNSMEHRDALVLFRKDRRGAQDIVVRRSALQSLPDAVQEMRRRAAGYTAGAIVPERLRVLRARRAVEQSGHRALPEPWMAERQQQEQRRVLQPQEDAQRDVRKPEPHEQEARRREMDAAGQFPVPQQWPERWPVWPRHLLAPPEQFAKSRQVLRRLERRPPGARVRIWL